MLKKLLYFTTVLSAETVMMTISAYMGIVRCRLEFVYVILDGKEHTVLYVSILTVNFHWSVCKAGLRVYHKQIQEGGGGGGRGLGM